MTGNDHSFFELKKLNWNVLHAILRSSVKERKRLFSLLH